MKKPAKAFQAELASGKATMSKRFQRNQGCSNARDNSATTSDQTPLHTIGLIPVALSFPLRPQDVIRFPPPHLHNTMAPSKPLTKTNRITKKGIAATKAAAKEQQEQRSASANTKTGAPARRDVNAVGPALDVNGRAYDAAWKESKKAMGKPSAFSGRVAALGALTCYRRLMLGVVLAVHAEERDRIEHILRVWVLVFGVAQGVRPGLTGSRADSMGMPAMGLRWACKRVSCFCKGQPRLKQ